MHRFKVKILKKKILEYQTLFYGEEYRKLSYPVLHKFNSWLVYIKIVLSYILA